MPCAPTSAGSATSQPTFRRAWAMPSRWTFSIKPIRAWIDQHLKGCSVIVDPFSGQSTIGTHRNDLGHGGIDAAAFCLQLAESGLVADAVLFDPPYSPRQISECYRSIGRSVTPSDTQNAALYARVREPLSRVLKSGGVALSFGWNTSGFPGWRVLDVLAVSHGGAHNDTLCVMQRKPTPQTPGGDRE